MLVTQRKKKLFYIALLSWAGPGVTPEKCFSKSPRPRWKGFFMYEMKLVFENNRWEAISSFSEKDEIKAAGFNWEPNSKRWVTNIPTVAEKFRENANELAVSELDAVIEKVEMSRTAEIAQGVEIPAPIGKTYFPYQHAGIAFASKRDSTFIGDEMGLGKTIQAIGVINLINPGKVLIVCPATLKLNWKKELEKWLVNQYRIHVLNSSESFPEYADIIIMNYDIAFKFSKELRIVKWDLFVADEAHYMKNPKAKRTVAIFGGKSGDKQKLNPIQAEKKILLTGTPISNRPIEIFPLISFLWPLVFRNMWHFAKRYCDATNTGYGWDMSGSSNLDELQNMLRANGMIRRLKADVLKELPPKTRQVLVLPSDSVSGLIKKEVEKVKQFEGEISRLQKAVRQLKGQNDDAAYKNAVGLLRQAHNIAFTEMAAIRKELAIAKIPFAVEYVRGIVEDGEKVVVMAHHREVIDQLQNEFGLEAVKLYGGMSDVEKALNVDRFQNDHSCKVFIGSIHAAGVGITLTAAQKMLFAELDWTPSNMMQAEDRIHRIGQDGNALIQQLVFDGSLDAKMAEMLVRKMEVIEKALDKTQDDEPIEIFEPKID